VFTSSDQKSDDTSPPKHDPCDFETSLRIHIRHDSDNERKYCTSNKKQTLFQLFLQFFKSLERTLSSSFELSQCLKVKAGALHKKKSCILLAFGIPRRALFTTEKKRKNNSAAQARPREARSLLASATTLQREATVPHSSLEHLVSNTCVSDSLNLSQKDQNSAIQEKKSPSLRNWHPSKCSTSM
jgi:hypothetical protein